MPSGYFGGSSPFTSLQGLQGPFGASLQGLQNYFGGSSSSLNPALYMMLLGQTQQPAMNGLQSAMPQKQY